MPGQNGQELSHLRCPVERTLGRRYPELPHPYRTEFQRDRDRIIHTRAFRRLEDKTQVFAPGYSDHFRNRLTHTIEVAQISRTVATALGLDEDLTEALALAHDIGHPPFAHAGEEELDRQMQRYNDSFDHNLHSLHIVETFEQRYARFPGLNLTFEVREGIAKHSRDFEPGEIPELDEYLPGARPPLEAQLIDATDEIAYNTADLDDAFAAGLIEVSAICTQVPGYEAIWETVQTQFAGAPERLQFQEALRGLIDSLVTGLIVGTAEAAAHAGVRDVSHVRQHPARLVRLAGDQLETNKALKRFLHRNVYNSNALARERIRSAQMIAELFEFFADQPDRLPEGYLDASKPLHRSVCDYIAGMTDGYFRRVYGQLLGVPASPAV